MTKSTLNRRKAAKDKPEKDMTKLESHGVLAPIVRLYLSDEEILGNIICCYMQRVVVPRLLAERRRKQGDPEVSPKDYKCGCPVSAVDGLPDCHEFAPSCRFRHRLVPRPRYSNDPVRHALFQRETRAHLKRLSAMRPEERGKTNLKMFHWYLKYQKRAKTGS